MEKKENLEEYMEYFKKQSLKEKKSIIFDQLKYLASMTNLFCKELNIDNEILLGKEFAKINKDDYTEDEYADAIIVLINSIQESICDYVIGIDKISDSIIENTE